MLLKVLKEIKTFLWFRVARYIYRTLPEEWQEGDRTVVIIPGFNGHWSAYKRLGDYLNRNGYKIHIDPKYNSYQNIEKIATHTYEYILKEDLKDIVVIGHSKGGIVARYLKLIDERNLISQVFTIASPHYGSVWAHISILSLFQIRPGSEFLSELNDEPEAKKVVNIFAKYDQLVIPNKSLYLAGAIENTQLDLVGHTSLVESDVLASEITSYLD